MTHEQTIFEATAALVTDQVMATPDVQAAWQAYREHYAELDLELEELDEGMLGALLLDVEAAVNAYAGELVRAAFLAGLAFDGRALLLDAAAG